MKRQEQPVSHDVAQVRRKAGVGPGVLDPVGARGKFALGRFHPSTPLERFVVQATQVFAPGQREGGFFVMIGRRPEGGDAWPSSS